MRNKYSDLPVIQGDISSTLTNSPLEKSPERNRHNSIGHGKDAKGVTMNIGQSDVKVGVQPVMAATRGQQARAVIPIQLFTERVECFCKLLADINKQAGGVCQ
jgi:hypothetical protein